MAGDRAQDADAAAGPLPRRRRGGRAGENRAVRLPGAGTLAGSALTLNTTVRNVVVWEIAAPGQALRMASPSAVLARRRLPGAANLPSGRMGAQGLGGWIGVSDTTGLLSSISGPLTGIEMDLSAGNADDAGGRFGIQATINAANSTMCEWGRFLCVNGQNVPGNVTWFKSMVELFAPYTVAGIDMSQGTQSISNPMTHAPNAGVAIKLRAGQKYGLNGDGLTGQYLTYDAASAQTELWSAGRLVAAFPDGGGLVVPTMPSSPAGLPAGAFYTSGNAVMRMP